MEVMEVKETNMAGGLGPRTKGQVGEREAKAVILGWLEPVYSAAGRPLPSLERNQMQSRMGGYDLVGIPWLALEVKRQENLNLADWWRQTLKQADLEAGQIPFLLWRQNRSPWKARVRIQTYHGPSWGLAVIDADLIFDEAKKWLQNEAWGRLQSKP